MNYHRWDVCKAAMLLGQKENLPVYKFLKEPLIRKFGEDWYAELELVVEEMKKQGSSSVRRRASSLEEKRDKGKAPVSRIILPVRGFLVVRCEVGYLLFIKRQYLHTLHSFR